VCVFANNNNRGMRANATSCGIDILQLLHCYTTADHTWNDAESVFVASSCSARPTTRKCGNDSFHRARSEGQVGRLVVTQLRFRRVPGTVQSRRQEGIFPEKVLCRICRVEWSCNVREPIGEPRNCRTTIIPGGDGSLVSPVYCLLY
jgi:hypothetical protein